MQDQQKLLVGGLVALLVLVWLGFTVYVSPRFAGSLVGGIFAIIGTMLMLVPFIYLCIKRIGWLKRLVAKRVSMQRLLEIHINAGVLGPILVFVHSSHKLSSPLGITLTALTILIVLSGFTCLKMKNMRDLKPVRFHSLNPLQMLNMQFASRKPSNLHSAWG